jgi:hypothetical protein
MLWFWERRRGRLGEPVRWFGKSVTDVKSVKGYL